MTNPQPLPVIVDRLPEIKPLTFSFTPTSCDLDPDFLPAPKGPGPTQPMSDSNFGPIRFSEVPLAPQDILLAELGQTPAQVGEPCKFTADGGNETLLIDSTGNSEENIEPVKGPLEININRPGETIVQGNSEIAETIAVTPFPGGRTNLYFEGGDALVLNNPEGGPSLNLNREAFVRDLALKGGANGGVHQVDIPTGHGQKPHALKIQVPAFQPLSVCQFSGSAFLESAPCPVVPFASKKPQQAEK